VSGFFLSHKISTIFHSGFFHSHFKIFIATISLFLAFHINLSGIKISLLIAGLKAFTNQKGFLSNFINSHTINLSALFNTLIILASIFHLNFLISASTKS
jgi:hypothetical protein